MRARSRVPLLGVVGVLLLAVACTAAITTIPPTTSSSASDPTDQASAGRAAALLAQARTHIRHVIFLIKENRSFDTLFGRFPGSDPPPAHVPVRRETARST